MSGRNDSGPYSTQIGFDGGGWYVEVYTDNDGGSGYGDNPRRGRWYGRTRKECEEVDLAEVELHDDTPDGYDSEYAAGYAYACGYHD